MLFNPNSSKQALEIQLSQKNKVTNHGRTSFNNTMTIWENLWKHLGLLLDVRLNFAEHINEEIKKANEGISVIRKLHLFLPCISLLTIYKSIFQIYLDYRNVLYNQPDNSTLSDKIKATPDNALLAMTGPENFHEVLSAKLPP